MSTSIHAALVVAAFLGSLAATRAVRDHARRRHLLDHPNERSSHSVPRPRLGGVGIMAAFLPAAIALGLLERAPARLFLVLAATAAIAALGLVDDVRHLRARSRFAVQLAAAAVVVTAAGTAGGSPWLERLPWPLAPIALVLWIVWLTNLYNFMDGIDGLAGGQAVLASIGIAVAAFSTGATTTAWVALLIGAAALGFLTFNFPPASIFMGDVGSTALGFLFASLPLLPEPHPIPVEVVALALCLFVLDATVTLFRRVARRERWFEAHRTHYYQRLVALGLGHRAVTLSACAAMALASVGAAAYPAASTLVRALAFALAAGSFALLVIAVPRLERSARRDARGWVPAPARPRSQAPSSSGSK